MRKTALIIIAGLIVAGGALVIRTGSGVKEVKAADRSPVTRISCLGRIVPGEKLLNITGPQSAYGPGIVKELLVKRGDKVKKNSPLAKLHNHALAEQQLAQAEAEAIVSERLLEQVKAGEKKEAIAAQQALVLKYEAELKNAEVVLARDKQLMAEKAISPNDFDRTELGWRIAQKNYEQAANTFEAMKEVREVDVRVAEARLESARASARRMKAELEQTIVRAPIDGVVLEIGTYPGEALDKAPLLYLGDIENLRIEAEVYVTDISHVKEGATAIITAQGVDGEVKGRVLQVGHQVDQSAIYNPDPATFSDKRVIKVWVMPEETSKLSGLVNHQVDVAILR